MTSKKYISVSQAVPGPHYLTERDVPMQFVGGPDGKLVIKQTEDGPCALAYMVVAGQPVLTKKYPLPLIYDRLRPRGPGRVPHPDHTWRAWAWRCPDLPRAILALVEKAGFYVQPRANYFAVGLNGGIVCLLYRSGHLGLRNETDAEFFIQSGFPVVAVNYDRYFSHHLHLEQVALDRADEMFLRVFNSFLSQYYVAAGRA